MYFKSLDFAIFLAVVFLFYWFIVSKNLKSQFFLIDHSHLNFEYAEIYTKYLYDEIKLKFDFE